MTPWHSLSHTVRSQIATWRHVAWPGANSGPSSSQGSQLSSEADPSFLNTFKPTSKHPLEKVSLNVQKTWMLATIRLLDRPSIQLSSSALWDVFLNSADPNPTLAWRKRRKRVSTAVTACSLPWRQKFKRRQFRIWPCAVRIIPVHLHP